MKEDGQRNYKKDALYKMKNTVKQTPKSLV